MRHPLKKLAAAVLSVAALLVGASSLRAQDPPPGGFKNPMLTVSKSGQVVLTYSRWEEQVKKGTPTLVFFWASWSDESRAEVPYVQSAYKAYSGKGLDVLGVPYGDEISDSMEAMTGWGITFRQLVDVDDDLAGPFDLDGVPYVVLLGPGGKAVASGLHGAEIARAVEDLLGRR